MELEQKIKESTAALEAAIEAGNGDCEADQKAASDALEAFIAERMAVWMSKATDEEANAKWQQDSYYRFSLLRLLNAKQAAIDAAVKKTNEDFKAALAEMKQDQDGNNAAQREIWNNFTADLRKQLVDAIAENDQKMLETVTERAESLASQLAEEQAKLNAAMDADQAEMKKNLKEIYNFNSHDIEESTKSTGKAAPYNHEQHQAFLYKLAYYMKDQLNQMDSGIANMADRYAAIVTSANEAADDENADAQEKIGDLREAQEKALGRLSASLIEAQTDLQDLELAMLEEMKDAAEQATAAEVERIRKNVIYAMHVLRYGGGKDALNTGFGQGASSYLGLGNSLIGIDTLDNFRLPNPHGYTNLAQVSDKINKNDDHFSKLQAQLNDSKAEFDTVIQKQRDDFAAIVAKEKEDSAAAAQKVKDDYAQATEEAKSELADLVASENEAMAENNAARKQALLDETTRQVEAFNANVDARSSAINGWFADRLEWLDQLDDSYMKKHLKKELEQKQAKVNSDLQARKDKAQKDADDANALLWDNLNATAMDLSDYTDAETAASNGFMLATKVAISILADGVDSLFGENADAVNQALNDTLDQMEKDWAFWLKYFYGYDGYETGIYKDYDDLADYSNVLNYARGDGAYLDLGYQGIGASEGGYSHLSGYGYGGVGGHDYLYSGDHTGLVYGKEIGPNPDYFQGSILDAAEEDMSADKMISSMMDKYANAQYSGLQF